MYLEYGQVVLKVIDMTRFERRTLWTPDGADLIGIDITFGATCAYAPGGNPRFDSSIKPSDEAVALLAGKDDTAKTLRNTPRGLPETDAPVLDRPRLETDLAVAPPTLSGVVDPGDEHSGPETDAELRAHLWLPRQKFILWAYDRQSGKAIRWMESPRPGFSVDIANGPRPLGVDIVSASGEPNSVAIHFQLHTVMSPCPIGSDRLVLSHRWQMSHAHDENFYLTRVIKGQIVFNGAVAEANQIEPDFVRAQFIHPIPLGFRRSVPDITQSSDGLTIRYTITDTDPTIVFAPGDSGAAQIQIIERVRNMVERAIPRDL